MTARPLAAALPLLALSFLAAPPTSALPPLHPRRVAEVPLHDGGSEVAVAGQHAYVVTNRLGSSGWLEVYDISVPSAPTRVGDAPLLAAGGGVAVAGQFAYVASDFSDIDGALEVYDVSTPSAPTRVGDAPLLAAGGGVAVAGQHAYVVTTQGVSHGGLEVYDIAVPSAPTRVGDVSLIASGGGVAVAGPYAYVVSDASHADGLLEVYDVSTPSAPTRVGSTLFGRGGGRGIAVVGQYAYVVANFLDMDGYFWVYDISIPSTPTRVGTGPLGIAPGGVAVAGQHAYVAADILDNDGELTVFDISTPVAPMYAGGASLLHVGDGSGIAASGASRLDAHAYVVLNDHGASGWLEVYDICPCDGDLDGDGRVTLSDLTILQNCINGPPEDRCDLSCDGEVDDCDLDVFMCQLDGGAGCCNDLNQNNVPDLCDEPSAVRGHAPPKTPEWTLDPAAPNPLAGETRVSFSLVETSQVMLRVYDLQGRCIATLVDQLIPAGFHSAVWDGCDDSGNRVAAGVYYVRLEAGHAHLIDKLVVLR